MEKKKRVVLDLRPLQTSYKNKGIGRYCHSLARELSQMGIFYSLVFKEAPATGLSITPLITAPAWRRQWIWDMFILPFYLWIKRVDLFHNFVSLGPLDKISPPLLFLHKSIITIHDIHMFEEDAGPLEKFYRNTARIQLQKFWLKHGAHLIFDSNVVSRKLEKGWGCPAERCKTIPLGCDHVDSWQKKEVTFPNGSLASKSHYILSVGDSPNKNLRLGYAVMLRLREKSPELNWVLCGNPNNIAHFLPLAEAPWIYVLSEPSDEELAELYQRAMLLLFPSAREGFGLPVLEAQRLGCPVVVGNIEPMSGHIGWKSKLNPWDSSPESVGEWTEECRRIKEDNAFRAQRIQLGKEFSSTFTWNSAAQSLAKLY